MVDEDGVLENDMSIPYINDEITLLSLISCNWKGQNLDDCSPHKCPWLHIVAYLIRIEIMYMNRWMACWTKLHLNQSSPLSW
jgi:hypothetical protein